MDPRKLFIDERLTGMCVYCGTRPDTRDTVPSKVLLDDHRSSVPAKSAMLRSLWMSYIRLVRSYGNIEQG